VRYNLPTANVWRELQSTFVRRSELSATLTAAMDNTVVIAIVAAASAAAGGVITGVVAPFVKHRLEQATAEKSRKREQIVKWRQMLLDVERATQGNISPGQSLHLHPEFITLEPYLSHAARKVARAENRTVVVGQSLSLPLEAMKNEIARIEGDWGLRG
jgi:hypothetical protein